MVGDTGLMCEDTKTYRIAGLFCFQGQKFVLVVEMLGMFILLMEGAPMMKPQKI